MIGTYNRLGLHVSASNLAVIRAARKKLNKGARNSRDPQIVKARKRFYCTMLAAHASHQQLVREWRI